MAQCKYCKRSGIFLSLTSNGLCNNCDPIIVMDIQQRARVIADSMELVKKSSKLDTQFSRCDLLLEHAQALTRYEALGIRTISPLPSELVRQYRAKRDQLVAAGLQAELDLAHSKVNLATGARVKVNHLSKVLLRIREFACKMDNPALLNELDKCTASEIHQIQLDAYLEEAKNVVNG